MKIKIATFVIRDRKTGKLLYQWDADFKDTRDHGFKGPLFKMAMVDHYQEQLKKLLRVEATVHRDGWKWKKVSK